MDTISYDPPADPDAFRQWVKDTVAGWPALTDRQAALVRDVFSTVVTEDAA
jgi:hypothetical protein